MRAWIARMTEDNIDQSAIEKAGEILKNGGLAGSSITCSAFVGLGRPDVLALGAAMKPPPAKISAFATLLLG